MLMWWICFWGIWSCAMGKVSQSVVLNGSKYSMIDYNIGEGRSGRYSELHNSSSARGPYFCGFVAEFRWSFSDLTWEITWPGHLSKLPIIKSPSTIQFILISCFNWIKLFQGTGFIRISATRECVVPLNEWRAGEFVVITARQKSHVWSSNGVATVVGGGGRGVLIEKKKTSQKGIQSPKRSRVDGGVASASQIRLIPANVHWAYIEGTD